MDEGSIKLDESGAATATATTKAGKNGADDGTEIVLGMLNAVGQNSAVTQRYLSKDLGIALGMANAVLKRCVRKGLIKVTQVPLNRYAYYLTPKGFSEKSRLTVEYLSTSLDLFRSARSQCTDAFHALINDGRKHIVLVGSGEVTEAAILSSHEIDLQLVCVVDANATAPQIASLQVCKSFEEALTLAPDDGFDGVMVTDMQSPQEAYDWVRSRLAALDMSDIPVEVPAMLGVMDRETVNLAEEDAEGEHE